MGQEVQCVHLLESRYGPEGKQFNAQNTPWARSRENPHYQLIVITPGTDGLGEWVVVGTSLLMWVWVGEQSHNVEGWLGGMGRDR